jgi:hypothetical protein
MGRHVGKYVMCFAKFRMGDKAVSVEFSVHSSDPIISVRSWFSLIIVACLLFGYFLSSQNCYACDRP